MPSSTSPGRPAILAAVTMIALLPWASVAATAPPTSTVSQDERACGLLSPELLFDILGSEAEDWERGAFDEPSYWACNYSWGTEGAVSQVTFAISKVGDQDPVEVYRGSTQALMQQGEHQELDDLGDRAVWIPGVPQLSVQAGEHVFHVSVVHPVGDEDDLEISRRLATELLARME